MFLRIMISAIISVQKALFKEAMQAAILSSYVRQNHLLKQVVLW